ncbi:MAG TPA: hypothetical protein DHW82_08590 [Spirochaetia bacterium]|nr:MAG: hypothetical protein A2Y41_04955 [Spirochaetes bacterium GWB1_36_13]HCL57047.1 hypothetical protein [Spirochaetia bacterium]
MLFLNRFSKSYGTKVLLQDTEVAFYEKEKSALIGANGTGKTTLLKILLGWEKEFEGERVFPSQKTILTVEQELPQSEVSLLDYILSFFPQKERLERVRKLEEAIHKKPDDETLMKEYSEESSLFEKMGGYDFIFEVKKILEGMGFLEKDFERPVISFSGGEKRRALMTALLVQKPDILVLDEPTNHLDIKNTLFLERFVREYPKTVIMVSHDRDFINNTVGSVCEIENHKILKYKGNLDNFLRQKEEKKERLIKEKKIYQDEYDGLFEFVSKFKAGTRSTQASSKEKRLEIVKEKLDAVNLHQIDYSIRFREKERVKPYDPPLKVEGISKSLGGKLLFENIQMRVKTRERTALLGINGSGKTTFFNILTGNMAPDQGQIVWNRDVKIGYLEQNVNGMDTEETPFDYLIRIFDSVYKDQEIKNYLGDFRLPFFSPVKGLSGGEKIKLKLLSVLMDDINFLLLDEPTNHLDIYSVHALKNIVKTFSGNIFFVTHDRDFIKSLNPELYLLNQGNLEKFTSYDFDKIIEHLGEYDFSKKEKKENDSEKKENPGKKNRNLKKQIDKLEELIRKKESEATELKQLSFSEEYYNDFQKSKELGERISKLEKELEEIYQDWEQYQNEI